MITSEHYVDAFQNKLDTIFKTRVEIFFSYLKFDRSTHIQVF